MCLPSCRATTQGCPYIWMEQGLPLHLDGTGLPLHRMRNPRRLRDEKAAGEFHLHRVVKAH